MHDKSGSDLRALWGDCGAEEVADTVCQCESRCPADQDTGHREPSAAAADAGADRAGQSERGEHGCDGHTNSPGRGGSRMTSMVQFRFGVGGQWVMGGEFGGHLPGRP